ncbi:MAG: hypothetical protein AB1531_09135 [Chloroflexota bacterium]
MGIKVMATPDDPALRRSIRSALKIAGYFTGGWKRASSLHLVLSLK